MPMRSPSRRSTIEELIALVIANVVRSINLILFACLSTNTSLFPAGDIRHVRGRPSATFVPMPVRAVSTHAPVPATVLTVIGEAVRAILLIKQVFTSVT